MLFSLSRVVWGLSAAGKVDTEQWESFVRGWGGSWEATIESVNWTGSSCQLLGQACILSQESRTSKCTLFLSNVREQPAVFVGFELGHSWIYFLLYYPTSETLSEREMIVADTICHQALLGWGMLFWKAAIGWARGPRMELQGCLLWRASERAGR